jgi:predicted SprT family Zn-dependent metalloprotease
MYDSPLATDLDAALADAVLRAWHDANNTYFRRRLLPPAIALADTAQRLGQWRPEERTIELQRALVYERSWGVVLEVLKHEMAHQFVDEILGGEERPHGPAFVRVCQLRGIDPAARASASTSAPEDREDRVIARVRKLLALAQSSNQHEAELAASTAQRLILKFNLDVQSRSSPRDDAYHFAYVGVPTGRVAAHQRALASLLIEHFFVRGIWVSTYLPHTGKSGSLLEICGRRENLQMAQFVHEFVSRTVDRLWVEHKKARGVRSNRDRRSFLAGAVAGFAAKLRSKRAEHKREGLVWVGDAGVKDYVRRRHPRLRSVRSSAQERREAYAEGQSAGRTIVLSRPVTSSAESGAVPRALPPGSK